MIVYVLVHYWGDGDGGQQCVLGVFSTPEGAKDAKAKNDARLGQCRCTGYDDESFEIEEHMLDAVVMATLQNHKPVTN